MDNALTLFHRSLVEYRVKYRINLGYSR